MRPTQRRDFVNAILDEITQPMGVPNEYVVEFFMPMLDQYELFHNVGLDEEEMDLIGEDDVPRSSKVAQEIGRVPRQGNRENG